MAQSVDRSEPILASWRISDVLARYPQLLEVLVGLSPAFSLLRNPVLRRVQSRLVTVEQAARIAGLDPASVVRSLNQAAGLAAPTADEDDAPEVRSRAAAPAWVGNAPVAAEVDARPLHERGIEPFSTIMASVARVPVGSVLRLRNSFEPIPLYDVLGRRGFVHWTRQLGPDDWEVLFFRDGAQVDEPKTTAHESATPHPPLDWTDPDAIVTIDVRDLVPPEPMIRILEALAELPPGKRVLVRHVRRPMHLYPRLDEMGYRHETRERGPNQIEILIEKPVDGEGAA